MYNIGLFNDSFPPIMDGVAMTVYNYAYWMQKKQEEVCVITPKVPDVKNKENFDVLRYASVSTVVRKPYRIGMPMIDMRLKEELNSKYRFGIVHAHSPFSAGKLALKTARKHKAPLIATFHSKFKEDFRRAVKNKYLVNFLLKDMMRFFENADEVWIPQASVEETIREYGYKGKLVVVDNGTDYTLTDPIGTVKSVARDNLNLKQDENVLLFVGQHIWEKNTALIIDALEILKNYPYKMYFVGMGYAANEMKALVDQKGLASKVEFTGGVYDREKLKQYYAASDLFLFPSLYDNAPLVVREAATFHTPSIITENSTPAEIITDNHNGFLIKNNPISLALKIKDSLENQQLLQRVGCNASKTIARSWENVTEEVLDRYKHLIMRKGLS